MALPMGRDVLNINKNALTVCHSSTLCSQGLDSPPHDVLPLLPRNRGSANLLESLLLGRVVIGEYRQGPLIQIIMLAP